MTIYTFTYPSERYDELNLNKQDILQLIMKHQQLVPRMRKNLRYYEGLHRILEEEKKDGPDTRLVCNHAKDISDTASSYFIGNPVTYNSDKDIKPLLDIFEDAGVDEVDGDNGLDLSINGRAYEYVYTKEGEPVPTIKNLSPLNTFMVHDDTIEENELFAVYYYSKKDDTDHKPTAYMATVCTQNYKYVMTILNRDEPQAVNEEPEPHFYGEVPIVEYQNNKLAIGDFELQIPLIDAYNTIMSDRVNDKEQFIDAILAVYGTLLGDDEEDEDGATETDRAMDALKKKKLVQMPDGSKMEYVTRTFDESGIEILRRAIEQDIHKFSHIPCMTDESFGGNVSGVAMEFKLLGMENITKIKTRYYKKGLRKRIRLFANFLRTRGINVDTAGISPIFTRAMPKNLLEISQIIANLWGKVSKKTLLSQIPFVTDVEGEVDAVEKEVAEAVKQQQAMFGMGSNEPPPDDGAEPGKSKWDDVDE